MTTNPTETLFKETLEVMNRAIVAHRDEFPYEQVTRLVKTLIGGPEPRRCRVPDGSAFYPRMPPSRTVLNRIHRLL